MRQNLLILAGTPEALALARAAQGAGLSGVVSFAGRVERLPEHPLERRVGGFGGASGLAAYLGAAGITHVIDATHPFAAQMSANAAAACRATRTPLLALTRAPWQEAPGDRWTRVADVAGAVAALRRAPARVMLAVGRTRLVEFAANPQHFYLLRFVDPARAPQPFPDYEVVVDRGPFTEAADRALMQARGVGLVVSKNSGGAGAYAKIAAARALGLPVIMIDRPPRPARAEVHDAAAALDWAAHAGADLGV
ncbi:cobalt-precorrin-6A reductase [Methylocella sp.]|uniref:cobalt-precorrin-6A reductase n=1 Tax=Methylocella sp. TaxID=1978226 RepID=UPI0037851E49